ncbi:MAG: hypothetical protein AB1742_15785 [bacterium]
MDDIHEFVAGHKRHIDETVNLLKDTLGRIEIGSVEIMAVATMLQNIYMGIENILDHILRNVHGTRTDRGGAWHKELLKKAVAHDIISQGVHDMLREHLVFRHYHVHGYGYMLKWSEMKPLAENAEAAVARFFAELTDRGYSKS